MKPTKKTQLDKKQLTEAKIDKIRAQKDQIVSLQVRKKSEIFITFLIFTSCQ